MFSRIFLLPDLVTAEQFFGKVLRGLKFFILQILKPVVTVDKIIGSVLPYCVQVKSLGSLYNA